MRNIVVVVIAIIAIIAIMIGSISTVVGQHKIYEYPNRDSNVLFELPNVNLKFENIVETTNGIFNEIKINDQLTGYSLLSKVDSVKYLGFKIKRIESAKKVDKMYKELKSRMEFYPETNKQIEKLIMINKLITN